MEKTCTKCGETKPLNLDNFVPNTTSSKDGYRGQCRKCKRAQDREALKDPGRYARVLEAQHRWYSRHPEKADQKARAWQAANPEKVRSRRAARWRRLRAEVLGHYGETCACCGSAGQLVIYADADGKARLLDAERESGQHLYLWKSGYNLYLWLVKNNFPDGFRALCMPCHRRVCRRRQAG